MANKEPAQITLTVFAARNLQSKRKGELCQASVVFGLGKDRYVTEVVESNSPEWNQEAIIAIPARNQSQNVKFKIRDKDHVLGVASLCLNNLGNRREFSKRWLTLEPHKKGHEVFGELLVECFVSEYRPGQVVSLSEKSSPLSGSQEDILNPKKGTRFSFHRRTPSWSKSGSSIISSSGGGSGSDGMASFRRQTEPESEMVSVRKRGNNEMARGGSSSFHGGAPPPNVKSQVETAVSLQPRVTGISPHEGPVWGGQRVILRGSNLGESRENIVKVTIADVDCTPSLEYISPTKLAVTTPQRHAPGRGPVKVETVNGGIGVSSVMFAFVESMVADAPEVSGISPREGSVHGGQRVVLRGSNLGDCRADVVKVVIADVDCTETLEYLSPDKLVVTTLPRSSAGQGGVFIETVRGGVSKGSLTFTYVKETPTTAEPILQQLKHLDMPWSQQHEADQMELKLLRQQIKDLKDDNAKLKEKNHALTSYIDSLLLTIIDTKPDILEVKSSSSNSSSRINISH